MPVTETEVETCRPFGLPIPSGIRPAFTSLTAEGSFNPELATACALRIIPIYPRVAELLSQDARRYDLTNIGENFLLTETEKATVQLFASLCSLLFAALGPAFVGRKPSSLIDMRRQFHYYWPVLRAMGLIGEIPAPAM